MTRLTPAEYTATVAKFEKINERAAKRGFTGRLMVTGVEGTHTEKDALGFERTTVHFDVEVTGQAPSYGGWTFLARVDRVEDTFTIATAPGVEHVDRSLVHAGDCDHCGHDRRRKNTYLVVNDETGETKNVGSTCIKDFLGWDASVVFFTEADAQDEIDSIVSSGSYAQRTYNVEYVLAVALAAIRAFGWVPASSYDRTPTRNMVLMVIDQWNSKSDREDRAAIEPFVAEANAKASAVREYVLSSDFSGDSTYVDNLKVAASLEFVTNKQVGLLASAPQAYIRHLERTAARAAEVAKAANPVTASDFIGAVKGKVIVTGTISAIRYIEGDYGTTTLYTILTTEGNLVKWFSSAGSLGDDTDVAVKISGTVKGHEEYRGTKSTVLTRCKSVA